MQNEKQSSKLLNQVNIQRVASPTFQIADRIRSMINDGDMYSGMRLPSTKKLAEQLNVDPTAVHRALSTLVKEGLLTRTPRVGTFVAEPPKSLERIAYYFRPMAGHFTQFETAVLNEVIHIGQHAGFVVEVFSDTRDPEISAEVPHPDLLREARTRRVQAVISASTSPEAVKWYNSLPIPQCTLSTPQAPHSLSFGTEQLIQQSVEQLHKRGCRKIAFINTRRNRPDPEATAFEMSSLNAITKALKKLDLPFRPEWVIGPTPLGRPTYEDGMGEFGFRAIHNLWDLENRPDGVLIQPDHVVQGALLAISQRSIRIPEDLQLLIHTNAEVPLFCPYPADRIVTRAKEVATALVRYVQHRLDHRTPIRKPIKCHLVTY